ncbi:MAG: AbrB/MazE/SpoVT family DNA-binding domain-containing protein [Gammaproteobacteria bacterium]|nr:AbrB/MazE/SpoVT family DNA-binding domain-containing protein [Gammaproteobacteria bacterium]MCY4345106.1 AbrB/MazE/SpoVT family DNA-binding domain-containing protein [Gammaproteobacteria bacterium]
MPSFEDKPSAANERSVPTRLFRNGNSQAVRIPRALAYEGVDVSVEIERRGDELVVRPVKRQLHELAGAFRKLGSHVQGFERDQPIQEPRLWDAHPAKLVD